MIVLTQKSRRCWLGVFSLSPSFGFRKFYLIVFLFLLVVCLHCTESKSYRFSFPGFSCFSKFPATLFSLPCLDMHACTIANNTLLFRIIIKHLVSISDPASNSFNLKISFVSGRFTISYYFARKHVN